MKLQCPREGLLLATQIVGVAVPPRTTHAPLAFIKAIAEDDRLILIATDTEIGIRYTLRGVQVEEAGEGLFAADRLTSILRETNEEEISIDADRERCLVSTATDEFEMPSGDLAGFPDFMSFEPAQTHELTSGALRTMIRRTTFAAAKESTKYAITGVLWELDEGVIRLVATDSKRLALIEGPATVSGSGDGKGQSQVVPTKAMQLLERNLSDDDEKIRVALRAQDVLFQTERSTIYARLVQGRFPPYRDIIPKKSSAKIDMPVLPFLSAVRRAAIMTDNESKRVAFHFGSGKLTLVAQGAATGRSKVEMPVEYDGPAIDINFDPSLLTDMLRVLEEGAPLTLELTDAVRPALFRSGKEYLYLVMPLS